MTSDISSHATSLRDYLQSVFHGNTDAVTVFVACLVARQHVVLVGEPGIGKTTLAVAACRALDLGHKRVQATSELWPSDIVGTLVWDSTQSEFRLSRGPIFCEALLIDELSRVPPRAQAALLEAMVERHVTIGDTTYPLPSDFTVVATENDPDSGTSRMEPALADRFAAYVKLSGIRGSAEIALVSSILSGHDSFSDEVPTISQLNGRPNDVHVEPSVLAYAAALATSIRSSSGPSVFSTRALVQLLRVSQAHALVLGRLYVIPDDVRAVFPSVACHRLGSFENARAAVTAALESVNPPR